jgi:hypothetical protein
MNSRRWRRLSQPKPVQSRPRRRRRTQNASIEPDFLRLRLVTSQGSPYPSRSPRAHPADFASVLRPLARLIGQIGLWRTDERNTRLETIGRYKRSPKTPQHRIDTLDARVRLQQWCPLLTA